MEGMRTPETHARPNSNRQAVFRPPIHSDSSARVEKALATTWRRFDGVVAVTRHGAANLARRKVGGCEVGGQELGVCNIGEVRYPRQ